MKNLEFFYENPSVVDKFIERKVKIEDTKTIIKGATNVGKSYLLLGSLKEYKNAELLYLNLEDFRVELSSLNLAKFVEKNPKIKALALDNLSREHEAILSLLPTLNLEKIVVTTKQNSLFIDGFSELVLRGLDFEEYLGFAGKGSDLGANFSEFLKRGNGLKRAFHRVDFVQNNLRSNYDKTELLVLVESAKFTDSSFSANKVYLNLKDEYKISKDSVYSAVDKFEDEDLIYFLPKLNSTLRRLYFGDFSFSDSLNYKKEFSKKLANTFFCELLKLNEELFFTDELDFYAPNLNSGFLIIPFTTTEFIFLRFKKILPKLKELDIKELFIITMGNEASLNIDSVKCHVVPFWQYALSL